MAGFQTGKLLRDESVTDRLKMTHVRNQRVTVLGLGHFGGGLAVSRWLVEQGATVTVVDDAPAERLADSVEQLAGLPISFRFGPAAAELPPGDLVVASPAVPPTHPLLAAARSAGVPVTTEICLFVERCPAAVFGVTGTKGKSTTSTLLARMLGPATWLGGNIGRSLLADLPSIRADHRVVLELSSFMLHYLGEGAWSPQLAVVTMLTRDHLDWHGSVEAYVDAKRQIVRHQTPTDAAVLNRRDPASVALAHLTPARAVYFNSGDERPFDLRLPGAHNQLNAQAAFAAAATVGVTWDAAQAAVADFAGLPHRLEVVADVAGVRWVNDSIATIPEAAVAALRSFPGGRVIQVVGGSGKKALDLTALCDALAVGAKAVLCIGETGEAIAAEVNRRAPGRARACGDVATAVDTARQLAAAGDVVLLSPGHPSYDQFVNFQRRGELFTRLARALTAVTSRRRPSDRNAPHALAPRLLFLREVSRSFADHPTPAGGDVQSPGSPPRQFRLMSTRPSVAVGPVGEQRDASSDATRRTRSRGSDSASRACLAATSSSRWNAIRSATSVVGTVLASSS